MFSSRVSTMSRFFSTTYDVCVVGGGPGGYVAAIKASQLGLKTVCVEKRGALGGTCLNVGCIPSKALLNISHKYEEANHSFGSLGIKIEGGLSYDLNKIMDNKTKIVTGLTKGIEGLFKKNGVVYSKGHGTIVSPDQVKVDLLAGGQEEIKAKNIIIATGSDAIRLPFLPCDEKVFVTSTGALSLEKVPKKMIVIGGGVIGLELGSVYKRLGAEVEVVEFLDRILPGMDDECASTFLKILKKQGISFKLGTKVVGGRVDGNKGVLEVEGKSGKETMEADVILIAIGRRAYTEGLGLDRKSVV